MDTQKIMLKDHIKIHSTENKSCRGSSLKATLALVAECTIDVNLTQGETAYVSEQLKRQIINVLYGDIGNALNNLQYDVRKCIMQPYQSFEEFSKLMSKFDAIKKLLQGE